MVLRFVHNMSSPEVSEQHVEIGLKKLYDRKAVVMEVALLLAEHYLESLGPASGAEAHTDRDHTHGAEDVYWIIIGGIVVD
jgi:hypothetical protein